MIWPLDKKALDPLHKTIQNRFTPDRFWNIGVVVDVIRLGSVVSFSDGLGFFIGLLCCYGNLEVVNSQ